MIRKIATFIMAVTAFITPVSFGCDNDVKTDTYSAYFFSIKDGDCTVFSFPDGKVLMIDCGYEENYSKIKEYLTSLKVKSINCLILTHPIESSIGGANSLIADFNIETCYVPNIENLSFFPEYQKVYQSLTDKEIPVKHIEQYVFPMNTDNYLVGFLTQKSNLIDGPIRTLNKAEYPTESMINEISPSVYVEYYGIRFIINSDASFEQETSLVDDFINFYGMLNEYREKHLFEIFDIDFLKVARHGDSYCTRADFLENVKPKNAIITTGFNYQNRPSSHVLSRLKNCGCNNIYRTDVCGNIGINIYPKNNYNVLINA